MLKRIGRCLRKKLLRSSSGVALTEVVIAVVILALIVASVPPVLLVIVKSQFSWSEQRVAESLSRNQMEYIKVAMYEDGNVMYPLLPVYAEIDLSDEALETYEIDVVAQPIDPDTYMPITTGPPWDLGIQEITVSISHAGRSVLQTTSYKVDRLDVLAL